MVERSDIEAPTDESDAVATDLTRLSDPDRRRVLTAMGGAGTVVLAGCLGNDDDVDDVATHALVFLEDDDRTEVDVREDEEILYPALDAGVDIPYRCEVGRCGDCTVKYDGDANDVAEHDGNEYLTDDQIRDGWVLTCVAYPRADSELEVAHPDDE